MKATGDSSSLLLLLLAFCYLRTDARAWLLSNGLELSRASQQIRRLAAHDTHAVRASALTAPERADAAANLVQKSSSDTSSTRNPRAGSTIIVGGGPSGTATALMLARRGYKGITVLERLQEPPPPASSEWGNPERSYNLGIGGRGQVALASLGAAERVLSWCATAVGRKDWNPQTPEGAERIFYERKYKTKVIARDRLASCLLEEVREKHSDSVHVRFGVECVGADWHESHGGRGGTLTVRDKSDDQTSTMSADFIVAADGVRSAVRDGLEKDLELTKALSGGRVRVRKFPSRNEYVYKVIPFRLDASWRNDFNYSYRTEDEITLEALPTKEGLQVGVLLFRPDNPRVLGLKSAADARALFEELFPQFADAITDEAYERLALQRVSKLPMFSYTGPVLHLGKSAVLLGDAIKSVKPYFGLGVNTAFEDITTLDRCLEEAGDDLSVALPRYSRLRAPEAKDLVELSRGFDRTGLTGFFGFILPLILDSVSHKAAPWLFAPNTIAFLQREGTTFRHIRMRKALDRVMQGAILGLIAASVFAMLRWAWGSLGPMVVTGLTATRA